MKSTGRESVLLTGVFCIALAVHLYCATISFRAGFLIGHEFRQAQTAISTYFIAHDHDYSLAYPTPLLGKPWSIPMEFPLYQWSVAALGNATGWSLPTAARTVSLGCFYLTLPAIFSLLGAWGIARARRLVVLTIVLTSPLYIF
ncbi:MAG TPA: hypothetical protein VFJ90_04800 [Candidatus Didemnitutus sp.]|nr:hypothetical protein [Candidatus Didemnitutus sp.]